MATSSKYPQTVEHPSSTALSAKLARILGENVRKRREAVQLGMNDVAAALQLNLVDYNVREEGSQRFTSGEIALLCDLLSVLPSALFLDVN